MLVKAHEHYCVCCCTHVYTALSRNKETEDSLEFSLSEGDDARTEQALQEAFDHATGQQNQQQQGDQDQGMSLPQDSLLGLHSSGKVTVDMAWQL